MSAPFLVPLIVALLAFAALWPLSVWRRDVSIVDVAWGPGFLVQVALAAALVPEIGDRAGLILGVVGVWSLRLGYVLLRRRIREGHEDPRYVSMRASWGPAFWWKSLFVVFCLQAVVQWAITVGAIAGIVVLDQDPGVVAWLGCGIAVAGLALEVIADEQLDRFKAGQDNATALMTSGLRAHVRHPNYLGEIIFWVGVGMIVLEGGSVFGLMPPILVLIFLTRVSGAPLLDERLAETRPEYAAYRARVPGFVPALRSSQRGSQ